MRKKIKWVAGLPLPSYLTALGLLFPALCCGMTPAGLPGGLFLLLALGEDLDELGKGVPLVRTYFGGSVVYMLSGVAIGVSDLLPKDSTEILGRFIESEGFLIFYTAALITGSPFQVDRRLLFRAPFRILSTALAGVAAGAAVVMLLGFLQGFPATESPLYIAIPMASDGVTTGAVPFSTIHAKTSGIPAGEILTRIAPTTVLGNIVSIPFGAFTARLPAHFLRLSGDGQLLQGKGAAQKKSTPQADFGSLLAGLLLSLAFYTADALLHGFIPALPAYTGVILCTMMAEGFSVLSGGVEEAAAVWGQFVIHAFMAAAPTGIGIVSLDLNRLASMLMLPYLLTIVLSVLVITLTADFVDSRLMDFYPLRTSVTADICTTSMGGSGNVAMLSAANHMLLLPFAQAVTRSMGALVLALGGIPAATLLH